MDYDVIILGGGMVGCATAYELSKYSLNIALIEKDYDVADDVAFINSSIVYDGVECKDDLAAKLENEGNKMMSNICEKFHIPFKKTGSLIIAKTDEEVLEIESMYEKAKKRGINNIELLDKNEIYKVEPNLNIDVKKAIYSKNTASIAPFDLAIAYAEIAFDNGVNFKLEEVVLDIQKLSKGYRVITNKNKFTCNIVLNTTPDGGTNANKDSIDSRKGSNINYFLLEDESMNKCNNIIQKFNYNDAIKRILKVPTVEGNTVLAVDSYKNIGYSDTLKYSSLLFSNIKEVDINTFYNFPYYDDLVVIDDSLIDRGYVNVVINHYGQVSMTPYVSQMICETVVNNINCVLKKNFIDKRREYYKIRELPQDEVKKIIDMDKRYGKIVCMCNKITEGEIVDSIRRPLGARTIEGIKRRTGAAFGRCKGGYCLNKLAYILARETDKLMTDIVKDSKKSNVMPCRIKEFDTM